MEINIALNLYVNLIEWYFFIVRHRFLPRADALNFHSHFPPLMVLRAVPSLCVVINDRSRALKNK